MKRLLLGTLMILTVGTSAFAGTHHHHHNNYRNETQKRYQQQYQKNKKIKSYKNREAEIFIEEKRLDIKKELLNKNLDWNKIEKLNSEIALKKSQCTTENMKLKFENRNKKINKVPKEKATLVSKA